jgi:hypothetical protein
MLNSRKASAGLSSKERVEPVLADDAALVGHQQPEQRRIVDEDEEQPDADREARRGGALAHQRAGEAPHGDEGGAEHDRAGDHARIGEPGLGRDLGLQASAAAAAP